MALLIFYLLLTMGISFLCSLLESVLMSTPISYITMKQDDGDRNAALFLRMKQDPDRPLSAILSLNTIANTLGAAAVGHQATLLSGEHWFGIISAAMTLLILVFSEIVPKSIGTSHWKDLLWLAKIMQLLVYLLYPVVWIIEKLHNSISDEEPDTVDFQCTNIHYAVALNVFDRLVETQTDGKGNTKIVPSLAESWTVSDDGLKYTFRLRKGVRFSDGQLLTASDVEYTLRRMLTHPRSRCRHTGKRSS